jgi:Tripartite tricarboxylate transporter TctB family
MYKRLRSADVDQLITVGLALFFLAMFAGSFQYHPMSRLFPNVVSGIGFLICMIHLFSTRRKTTEPDIRDIADPTNMADLTTNPADPGPTNRELARGVSIVVAGTISFILLGFWITSLGLVLIVPRVMGWRANPLLLLAIAVVTAGCIAFMFNFVLKSPMPSGIAVDWLGDVLQPTD